MSDLATFKGTYSDIKLIRSRKVAVVCVEIPIEAATAFVNAFGMPDPASETWVALARINNMQNDTPKEKRPFSELPAAQQAALACKREAFQRYVYEQDGSGLVMDEDHTADYVRNWCGVESRSELASNANAAYQWEMLYQNFQLWLEDAA